MAFSMRFADQMARSTMLDEIPDPDAATMVSPFARLLCWSMADALYLRKSSNTRARFASLSM